MQHRQHFQARELLVPNDFARACVAKAFLARFFWDREHCDVKHDAPHCPNQGSDHSANVAKGPTMVVCKYRFDVGTILMELQL